MIFIRRFWRRYSWLAVLILVLLLMFIFVANLAAEVFWFQELGYLPTLVLRLQTQAILWIVGFVVTGGFLLGNLVLARRLKHPMPVDPAASVPRRQGRGGMRLRWLLPLVLVLSAIVGLMLLHYGQMVVELWKPNLSLTDISPTVPPRFRPQALWTIILHLPVHLWQGLVLLAVLLGLLIDASGGLCAIAALMSAGFGFVLSGHWSRVLQCLHLTLFDSVDEWFHLDISLYVFILPILELLGFWLVGVVTYGLIAVTLVYLLSGDSLSQGYFPGFSQAQQRHVSGLGSCLMLAVAFSYGLSCLELLYSTGGVTYGAGFTDVMVKLPVNAFLGVVAVAIAGFLLARLLPWRRTQWLYPRRLLFSLSFYIVLVATAGAIAPAVVQRLVVQPNELARETTYINRSIQATREAFDLNNIEVRTFDPDGNLTTADLKANDTTINNIRLWDTRPLLQTNRQLQQIRLYYKFPDADIDRYRLPVNGRFSVKGNKDRLQQVIIAPRELDYSAVPERAKTWVNEHLIYTHGYGFTLSPVNTAGPGGLPDYFVKDIGVTSSTARDRTLSLTDDALSDSIPIGQPRIYYGELTQTYVMTSTRVRELDYPSGDRNVYNVYDGSGGVSLGAGWRRLLFAVYLRDWQMLLTQNFRPETKLLFRRNIRERIRAIAPFLRYDRDPYIVVANAKLRQTTHGLEEVLPDDENADNIQNYLYWIVDAYTTSDRYPYSDPGEHDFNYIRNSVKVVIDAYNGSVNFYIADPRDPIVRTWETIFPGMFQPLEKMPLALRSHIRYPEDLFNIQSERLLSYHMEDPQVFYNREDQWQVPTEIYGNERQPVEPYYLIMRLPTARKEEFILLHPFTPTSRNNLTAWLAGRSDGQQYGKLLLYKFPKQRLVYGPEQIEARINQDPAISQRITLWDRQGSSAIQGNLLVIPIEQSLLYVEPLYLEAERNSLPTLARVIVAYENQIAMSETLDRSLQTIFAPTAANTELRDPINDDRLLEAVPAPPPPI